MPSTPTSPHIGGPRQFEGADRMGGVTDMRREDGRPVVGQCILTFLPGSQTFVYDQVTALRAYRPVVLTRWRDHADVFPWPSVALFNRASVPPGWHRLAMRALYQLRRMSPWETAFFAEVARRERLVLLHAHFGVDARYFLRLKSLTGLPMVTTWYGYDASSYPRRWGGLGRVYLRALFAQSELMLALSEDMRRCLIGLGCPAEKVRVHHFGIDVGHFPFSPPHPPSPEDDVHLVMVGRFVEKKGVLELLRAFALARARRPRLQLTMVGDGPLRPDVERFIAGAGLADAVTLPGFLPHPAVQATLARSHVFVLPSITARDGDKEGTPTVLMEAMATGLPVVATRHAGIPELVPAGEAGLLVPERDVPALADALLNVVSAQDRWGAWGAAGRRRVEMEYNAETLARRLEAIYDQLTNGMATARPSAGRCPA